MIKNYLKTALRSLARNKNFSLINIAGLSVGIAVCIVIFLIIQFELSFENFHANKERIFRVLTQDSSADGVRNSAGVPYALPATFEREYPSILSSAVYSERDDQIQVPDPSSPGTTKKFKEDQGFFFADPSFFKIFSYPLLTGEFGSLNDPNTVIITRETADRYFGDWHSALGQTIKRNNKELYKIIGVLADIPSNTDLQIKLVASYATRKDFTSSTDWQSVASNHGFYILLPKGMTAAEMNDQLKQFVKKYKKGDAASSPQFVESLLKVHYDTETGNFSSRVISKSLINTLWMIAAFILLIACVNFINLSTAQAVNRSKEIAVRKVVGGNRQQLRFQFYMETAIITLVSIFLSVFLAAIALPFLRKMLSLPLHFDLVSNPIIFLFLLIIGILVTVLAGFYPALVLSRFNPVTALKNKLASRKPKGISMRRGLVVFQFVIAQGLIIGTFVIVRQMDYFRNHSMGFDKHAIVNVSFPNDSIGQSKLVYLKNRLLSVDGVKHVSFSFASPADNGNWSSDFKYDHAAKETDWSANLKWADADYLKTYGLSLVAGRNLNPSDTVKEFLVNETLLKRLGITHPEEALNKEIDLWDQMKFPIVGVVRDFNANSLKKDLSPVIITTAQNFYEKAGIKMETADMNGTLKKIESIWNTVYPDYVYEQKFLDTKIDSFYAQENKLSKLYKVFAALAIFLSCLGLYGLASFMAVQRIKEVGIRKVLGASVGNILYLFSKEFVVLILIAFAIACPLAWYFMHGWLKDFVYRVSISWWILGLAAFVAVAIALLTISIKAFKAALSNPVTSLKTE